jgi:hypothetical protein
MSKSDLKARPIFHHTQEAIEAHLTVVMAALAIGRTIESKTGLSVKRFVKIVRTIRSGTVVIGIRSTRQKPSFLFLLYPFYKS